MPKHLFNESNTDIVYKAILYLFNVDGIMSEDDNAVLLYFLLMTSRYQSTDNEFQASLGDDPDNINSIVDDLKAIEDKQILFHFMLQILALVSINGLSDAQKNELREIFRLAEIDKDAVSIFSAVFLEPDIKHKNVLILGNNSDECDIVKTTQDIRAYITGYQNTYYFFSLKSNGLLKINHNAFFDQFVLKMDVNDTLSIDSEIIPFTDVMFRAGFKEKDFHGFYSIVQKDEEGSTTYALMPGDIPQSIGQMLIKGCHIVLVNTPYNRPVSIGEYNPGKEVYTGCLDDKILIDNSFVFDISRDLASLVLSETISLQIADNKRVVIGSGKDLSVDLKLPGETGDKIIIEQTDGDNWEIDTSLAKSEIRISGKIISEKRTTIESGSILQIGKNNIIFDPAQNTIMLMNTQIQSVKVRDLTYRHNKRSLAINHITFENYSKDFVCVMGPSGSGKTTLVQLLSGYIEPENPDSILYNNLSLNENYNAFKKYIGYVGQDDVLFENLSVYENMYYYGRLRSPELSREILDKKITKILIDLGLSNKRDKKVGSPEHRLLSGGERKRLAIGLELISDCEVLILDEPTSGLSSFDAAKIADILSYIAKQGKIVYVVIHQPSTDMFLRFSHFMLIDEGGHLAYFGRTKMALRYFSKYALMGQEIKTPADIIDTLEAVKRAPDGEIIFEEDERHQLVPIRLRTPQWWQEEFNERRSEIEGAMPKSPFTEEKILPKTPKVSIRQRLSQFNALFMRNALNKFKDKSSTIFAAIIPILLSLSLSAVLRSNEGFAIYRYSDNANIPKFLFLTSIIFIFLAISSSISEILKDRVFLYKEKIVGYSPAIYLLAKIGTLAIIALYQVSIYLLISFWVLKMPVLIIFEGIWESTLFTKMLIFSFISALASITLGLFISVFLSSEKSAFFAVPLMIIPQIIFGGLFLSFHELKMLNLVNKNRPVPIVCSLTYSRWMYEAYLYTVRYDHPGKNPNLTYNHKFYQKYGEFQNKEIIDLFRTYNLSKSKNEAVKVILDENHFHRMRKFAETLKRVGNKEVAISEYIKIQLSEALNYFPYYKKILYPFVIDTYSYDLLVMIFFTVLFYILASVKLYGDSGKQKPKDNE